jgi:hypothetical protein
MATRNQSETKTSARKAVGKLSVKKETLRDLAPSRGDAVKGGRMTVIVPIPPTKG